MSTVWGGIDTIPQSPITSLNTITRDPNTELDRQAFLQLLITQLRHQDPLNPMDDREFIAQMAQFSALEQMMNLNQTFERHHAFGTLGRTVDAAFVHPVTNEWTEMSGLVTAVNTRGSQILLTVNGIDVPFDAVRSISEDFFVSHQLDAIFQHILSQEANNLIGRYIQAIAIHGERQEFIEGRVTQARMNPQTGQIILTVGNRDVFRHEVTGVAGTNLLLNVPGFVYNNQAVTVANVDIVANRAYLVFNNGSRQHIERINYATEALTFMNREIAHAGVQGTVGSIFIRSGVPHFNIYDYRYQYNDDNEPIYNDNGDHIRAWVRVGTISYLNYLAERIGVEAPDSEGDD